MNTLEAAFALIWRQGQVLTALRSADARHLANVWEFPGGKREPDESLFDCVKREAREELGVEIEVLQARPPIVWQYPTRRVALYPFDCRIVAGEPQALESQELRWVPARELRADEFPPANAGLIETLRQEAR